MKRISALFLAVLLAAPAMASSCPMLASQIDQHLADRQDLSPQDHQKVKNMRDEGMKYHQQGKHDKSVEILSQALSALETQGN